MLQSTGSIKFRFDSKSGAQVSSYSRLRKMFAWKTEKYTFLSDPKLYFPNGCFNTIHKLSCVCTIIDQFRPHRISVAVDQCPAHTLKGTSTNFSILWPVNLTFYFSFVFADYFAIAMFIIYIIVYSYGQIYIYKIVYNDSYIYIYICHHTALLGLSLVSITFLNISTKSVVTIRSSSVHICLLWQLRSTKSKL